MKRTVLGSPMKNIIVLIDQPLLLSWDSGGCASTLDDMQDIPCNSANCHYRALVSLHLIEFSCLRMRYPNCKRLISETATQYDFQCVAWEFAWPLHSVCLSSYEWWLSLPHFRPSKYCNLSVHCLWCHEELPEPGVLSREVVMGSRHLAPSLFLRIFHSS